MQDVVKPAGARRTYLRDTNVGLDAKEHDTLWFKAVHVRHQLVGAHGKLLLGEDWHLLLRRENRRAGGEASSPDRIGKPLGGDSLTRKARTRRETIVADDGMMRCSAGDRKAPSHPNAWRTSESCAIRRIQSRWASRLRSRTKQLPNVDRGEGIATILPCQNRALALIKKAMLIEGKRVVRTH